MSKTNELTFQNEMIKQLVANGWKLGKPENYNVSFPRSSVVTHPKALQRRVTKKIHIQ